MLNTFTKEPSQSAQACVIWLHGLGSSAENMQGVLQALPLLPIPIRHVFVDAPVRPVTLNNRMLMPAWYDIRGMSLQDREDKEGILESMLAIEEIIAAQIKQGMQSQQIYLAGFSQGGAMALLIGLRTEQNLGGVLALSAYLPLQNEAVNHQNKQLPIFMAMGTEDLVVLPQWTKLSYEFIKSQGFTQIVWKEYTMEHTICYEEVRDIAQWLHMQIQRTNT